jgi:hypothetical protein
MALPDLLGGLESSAKKKKISVSLFLLLGTWNMLARRLHNKEP